MTGLLVLVVLAAFVVFFFVGLYNKLVFLRNGYKNAFSQIDVQLKRRYDLIPNLVETAKAYLKHERETLEAVIAARNTASTAAQRASANPGDPSSIKNLSGAEAALSGVLTKFFALSEAYPDLKANENMKQLTEELSSTENRVAFARQAFNDAVMSYNNSREAFPGNMIANQFNFQPAQLWEIEATEERIAPKVKFA